MPKIHITGRKLPKAKKGFSVNTEPCPPGPNGQKMIRVDGQCIEVGKTEKPVFPTMTPGEWSYKYNEEAIQRALSAGEPIAPGPGTEGEVNENGEDASSYKIVNGQKVCGPGYINIDGVCVKDVERDYNVYEIPGKPGQFTTAPMPVGTPQLLQSVFVTGGKRENRWYDDIVSIAGINTPKELRNFDKAVNRFSNFFEAPFRRRDRLTDEQKSQVSDYWSQQMQDPVVRERVKNDPMAYQMLRLEAYREAGAGNKVLKKEACVAGFGFHWDEEKQTCVEDQAPHYVSGEASIRTINPVVYRELFEDIDQLAFDDHDSRIKTRIPKNAESGTYKMDGGALPYYAYNPIEKDGGYTENGMLSRLVDSRDFDQEGQPSTKVADIFRSAYYENDLNNLNKFVSDYKKDEYQTDQNFEKTITQIQKEGLGDFIAPGQNRQFVKQRLLETAEYAPGVSSGDAKKEATRLPGLFGKDVSGFNRWLNTQNWKMNKSSATDYGLTGNPVRDFFTNMARGTYADVLSWANVGREGASKLGIGTAPKTLEGYSIYSPTVTGRDQNIHGVSNYGLAGGTHLDEFYGGAKNTAQDITDIVQGKGSVKKALRVPVNFGLNVFDAFLASPGLSFSRGAVKPFSKATVNTGLKDFGYKYFTKPGLRTTLGSAKTSLITPFKETIGTYAGKSIPGKVYTAAGVPVRALHNFYFGPATTATMFPAKVLPYSGKALTMGGKFKIGEEIGKQLVGEENTPFPVLGRVTGMDNLMTKFYDDANITTESTGQPQLNFQNEGRPSFDYYDQSVAQKEQENIDKGQEFLNDPNQRRLYKFFPQEYKDFQEGIYNVKSGGKTYKFDTRLFDKNSNQYANKLILDALTANKKQLTPSIYDYNKKTFNLDIDPQIKQRVGSFFKEQAPYLQSIQVNKYGGVAKRKRK